MKHGDRSRNLDTMGPQNKLIHLAIFPGLALAATNYRYGLDSGLVVNKFKQSIGVATQSKGISDVDGILGCAVSFSCEIP